MTYEQIIDNCKPSFRKKLQHTVELLRKAEKLALTYDSEDGFFLAFSGGKDSQALYHSAMLAGVKFKAHMALTSIDPPEVIRFVKSQYRDVVLHKPKDSIYNLFIKNKKLLPSRIIRWCCAELKEEYGAGTVCLTGVRRAESVRRQKRNPVEVSDKSFTGELDGFFIWQEEKIRNKLKHLNKDQYSEHGETEVRCINGRDKIIVNPIIDWSDKDVWYFLNEVVKVKHCELYDRGYHRIGCICCPMSTYKQKLKEIKEYPHVKRNWLKAIKSIRQEGEYDNMITKNYWGEGTEDEKCEQVIHGKGVGRQGTRPRFLR